MPVNNVPTKAEVEHGDPLTERIRESIIGVENLRAENRRLSDESVLIPVLILKPLARGMSRVEKS